MTKDTGPTPETKYVVRNRSEGRCERCGVVWFGHGHIHHRQPRKMGGSSRPSINYTGNLLHLCRWCHDQIESNRVVSKRKGWLVPEPLIPAEVPVKLWNGWFLLTDAGDKISVACPAAERGL